MADRASFVSAHFGPLGGFYPLHYIKDGLQTHEFCQFKGLLNVRPFFERAMPIFGTKIYLKIGTTYGSFQINYANLFGDKIRTHYRPFLGLKGLDKKGSGQIQNLKPFKNLQTPEFSEFKGILNARPFWGLKGC